jgi:hypothetical protein
MNYFPFVAAANLRVLAPQERRYYFVQKREDYSHEWIEFREISHSRENGKDAFLFQPYFEPTIEHSTVM